MDYGMHYSGSSHSCPPSRSTEKHKSGKKRHTPRDKLSEERLRALREKDAERKRNRRVQMTEEERKQEREKDKARKANKRKQQKAEALAAEQRTVLPPVESLLPPYSPVYPPPQQPPPRVATTLGLAPIVDLPMRYNQY